MKMHIENPQKVLEFDFWKGVRTKVQILEMQDFDPTAVIFKCDADVIG